MRISELHRLLIEVAVDTAKWLKSVHEDVSLHEIVGFSGLRDVTRKMDITAENMIVNRLTNGNVKALVVCEESGVIRTSKEPEFIVLVDPLDGSNNYISGIPYFSVSIAYAKYSHNAKLEDLIGGIVVDVDRLKVYHATRGKGAFIDDKVMEKYKPPGVPMILGYLNSEAYLVFKKLEEEWGLLKLRSLGSASLDLVHVARGGAEVFADLRAKLRVVDIAGGYVILREMGGKAFTGTGEKLNPPITRVERIPSIVAYTDEEAEKNYWRIIEVARVYLR